jgi:hypothetical protein
MEGKSSVLFGIKSGVLAGVGVALALVVWFLVINEPPAKVDTTSIRAYGSYLLVNAVGWAVIGGTLGCFVGASLGAIAGMVKWR